MSSSRKAFIEGEETHIQQPQKGKDLPQAEGALGSQKSSVSSSTGVFFKSLKNFPCPT